MKPAIEELEATIDEAVSSFDELAELNQMVFMNTEEVSYGWSGNWKLSGRGKQLRRKLLDLYGEWKQQTEPIVERYLPERDVERFQKADEVFRLYLDLQQKEETPVETKDEALDALHLQKRLVEAVPSRIESERLVNPRQQSVRLLNEELRESKRLLDDGLDRPAGVLASVALERHLIVMAESSSKDVDFSYSDSINPMANSLREAGVIDKADEKLLIHLAEIRAKCAHADGDEPGHDEVSRLVDQVDEFIERHS